MSFRALCTVSIHRASVNKVNKDVCRLKNKNKYRARVTCQHKILS